jgi:hypothetical protein
MSNDTNFITYHSVSGNISGLSGFDFIRLGLFINDSLVEEIEVSENGSFTFLEPLKSSDRYNVIKTTTSNGQNVILFNYNGTISNLDINNVYVIVS